MYPALLNHTDGPSDHERATTEKLQRNINNGPMVGCATTPFMTDIRKPKYFPNKFSKNSFSNIIKWGVVANKGPLSDGFYMPIMQPIMHWDKEVYCTLCIAKQGHKRLLLNGPREPVI